MTDDFGCRQTAEVTGDIEGKSARQTIQEARGVEIAGAGRVDDVRDRSDRNRVRLSVDENDGQP